MQLLQVAITREDEIRCAIDRGLEKLVVPRVAAGPHCTNDRNQLGDTPQLFPTVWGLCRFYRNW